VNHQINKTKQEVKVFYCNKFIKHELQIVKYNLTKNNLFEYFLFGSKPSVEMASKFRRFNKRTHIFNAQVQFVHLLGKLDIALFDMNWETSTSEMIRVNWYEWNDTSDMIRTKWNEWNETKRNETKRNERNEMKRNETSEMKRAKWKERRTVCLLGPISSPALQCLHINVCPSKHVVHVLFERM
jgi:hypothetical protein